MPTTIEQAIERLLAAPELTPAKRERLLRIRDEIAEARQADLDARSDPQGTRSAVERSAGP